MTNTIFTIVLFAPVTLAVAVALVLGFREVVPSASPRFWGCLACTLLLLAAVGDRAVLAAVR